MCRYFAFIDSSHFVLILSRSAGRNPAPELPRRKTTLSWLTSRLFWKTLGIYLLLSLPALAIFSLATSSIVPTDQPETRREFGIAAAFVWVYGLVAFLVATHVLRKPFRKLIKLIQVPDAFDSPTKQALELIDRTDEIGSAARAFEVVEKERAAYRENALLTEEQMRSSASTLSAVLQAMVEGVIAVDRNEQVLFANATACSMLSIADTAICERRIFECIRSSHAQATICEALNTSETKSVEFSLPNSDCLVAMVASPFAVGGAVLVLEDVTEHRRLETLRRDFVSGVSHELKTPLTVIQACIETLLDGAVDDPSTARRFLEQIQQQSDRLLHLITGMLKLARVESGQQIFDEVPVDLSEIARDIVRDMAPLAEGNSISLRTSGATELFVLGDHPAIRTIVVNLVENALKYTNENGSVEIQLELTDTASTLKVIDDGIGIAEKDQERVFERFFRVQRDRNRERGGTGLGLAIVKHLCEAMHATIDLNSRAGQGTTVTVSFPFRD